MRPQEHQRSEFGAYLAKLCARMNKTVYDVCMKAGITTKSRITYGLRQRDEASRSTLFSHEELIAIASEVIATKDERNLLILLGLKQHAPPALAAYIRILEVDSGRLREAAAKKPLHVNFMIPQQATRDSGS